MPELTKINPVLHQLMIQKYFKQQLLYECPKGRNACKEKVIEETETAHDEINRCANCISKTILEQCKL
jgi:hypothetical protein